MCFSATASAVTGLALLPVGAYCIRTALEKDSRYLGLAALPIVFALQQLFEAIVWQGIGCGNPLLIESGSLGFLFFALAFWPFWVPWSTRPLESRPQRKQLLTALAALGCGFTFLLYLPLAMNSHAWLQTSVAGHSIHYEFTIFPLFQVVPGWIWQLCYFAAVTIPLLTVAEGKLRTFGGLVAISAAISQVVFWYAFVSIWCFFAALLSAYLCFVIRQLPLLPAPLATR